MYPVLPEFREIMTLRNVGQEVHPRPWSHYSNVEVQKCTLEIASNPYFTGTFKQDLRIPLTLILNTGA